MPHVQAFYSCNTFCCWLYILSSLYIKVALVCCTKPDNIHCFGTIFPKLNFVFASICAARPVRIQSTQYRSCSSVKQRRDSSRWGAIKNIAVALKSRNDMISIHQRVRGRMMAKQRWFKATRELCHEWFYSVRHYVHDVHWTGEFATVIRRLHCFTVSLRGDVRG